MPTRLSPSFTSTLLHNFYDFLKHPTSLMRRRFAFLLLLALHFSVLLGTLRVRRRAFGSAFALTPALRSCTLYPLGGIMLRMRFAVAPLLLALTFVVACNKVNDDTIATDIKAKMFSEPLLKSLRSTSPARTASSPLLASSQTTPLVSRRSASLPKPRASSRSSIPPP